ncbi:Arylsulfatase [Planctomycetes bacterium CA13]|uniref:Arylsulfatase n=1 Tax=Novipirellula herctigrandis TaxID=2527986 RepID=A0A5C5ZDA2_9BACT|nr:Arylsulfatase [Planctomycetes bacterium CA13]
MNRQLSRWLLLLGMLLFSASMTHADEKLNVLWIIADDLSPDLSCYGYEGIQTPNIDRLAEQGTRYDFAFSTSPVCSASRSAFITGVYQTSTSSHQHRTVYPKPLPDPVEPITELLRRAGYFVCNSNSAMNKAGKVDYNFSFDGELFDAPNWSARKEGQPFFAQVQIHEPHRPFVQAKDIHRADDVEIPSYYPDHPVIRADWANYLETIEVLDSKVGKVMDRLREKELLDNTVVIFFGDHGRPHYRGKQWLFDGGVHVPLIVRWPGHVRSGEIRDEMVSLIDVAATTLGAAGMEVPAYMDGQNIFAKDFKGREAIFAARDRCGSTLDRIRCVRTKRFKYIRNFYPDRPYAQHSGYKELQYPGMTVARVLKQRGELGDAPSIFWADKRPAEELYDMVTDPEELNNLANHPEYASTLSGLRTELDQWMDETGDRGDVTEENLQTMIQSSEQWYRDSMKKRGLEPNVSPETYLQWWEKKLGLKSQ